MIRDWCNIPVSVQCTSTGRYRDMHNWLLDNFNAFDWDIEGRDVANYTKVIVRFARQKDAVLFSLRWV